MFSVSVASARLNKISYLSTLYKPSCVTAQLIDYKTGPEITKAEFYIFPNGHGKREKLLVNIYQQEGLPQLVYGNYYFLNDIEFQNTAPSNPGEFDYGFYLRTKGFSCAASVTGSNIVFINRGALSLHREKIFLLRDLILTKFKSSLTENEYSFLSGVLFGAGGTDGELNESVRKGGLAHILAVSGMHVGIIYAFLTFLLKPLFRSRAYIPALAVTFLYVAISGFSVSALRAFIMLFVLNISKLKSKRYDPFNSLCLAYEIIAVFSPLSIFTISMQLSFCACSGIIFIYPLLCRKAESIRSIFLRKIVVYICLSLSAMIFVAPVSCAYFGEFHSCFLLTNLLIVPLIPILFVTALLYVLFAFLMFPCGFLLYALKLTVGLIGNISGFFASLPFALIKVPQTDIHFTVLWYIAVFSLFGYTVIKKRYVKIAVTVVTAAVFLGFIINLFPIRSETRVAFLDAGCADCCLIMTKDGHNIMIDCGSRSFSATESADYNILPFLGYYRINHLDAVFISHTDRDHCGALESILSSGVVIDHLYINNDASERYRAIYALAERSIIPIYSYREGDYIEEGGLFFNVLWPRNSSPVIGSGNAESAVIYLHIESKNFLFCADIGENATKALTETYILNDTDIVKVAHHGSYNGALGDFLLECCPEICIISVGANSYSLPNKETVSLIGAVNAETLLTQDSGCIIFEFSNGDCEVKQYREKKLDWSGR